MTTLLALLGFAALFALAGIVPLKGEGGGCGSCGGSSACGGGHCEMDVLDEILGDLGGTGPHTNGSSRSTER